MGPRSCGLPAGLIPRSFTNGGRAAGTAVRAAVGPRQRPGASYRLEHLTPLGAPPPGPDVSVRHAFPVELASDGLRGVPSPVLATDPHHVIWLNPEPGRPSTRGPADPQLWPATAALHWLVRVKTTASGKRVALYQIPSSRRNHAIRDSGFGTSKVSTTMLRTSCRSR